VNYYADHRDYGVTYMSALSDHQLGWAQSEGVQVWADEEEAIAAIDAVARAMGRQPCYGSEFLSNGENHLLCWSSSTPGPYLSATGKMIGRLVGPFDTYQAAMAAMPKNKTYGRA
jgi:hypothetical protein